jgi:hypothetical protein
VDEVERWVSAFQHAKEEASLASERIGVGHRVINNDDEFTINGPRAHRSYTKGICKLITISRGKCFELLESLEMDCSSTIDLCHFLCLGIEEITNRVLPRY